MAGIRSNVAWVQLGKQSAKDTPAVTYDYRTALSSDDRVAPRAETATFAETDASRDAPNSEKVTGGAEGSYAFGVRDAFFHKPAEMVLGALATTGAGPNYVHTVTTADVLSYYTAQANLGDVLWEQHQDLIANEWTVSAEAAGFLTSSISFLGRKSTRLTSAPTGPTQAAGPLYNFNDAAVSIGGAGTALVRSFSMTVNNNLQVQQTDDYVPYDVYVGQREVTVGFDMLFHTLDEYNAFHYGSPTGTVQNQATYITDLNFLFSKGVNNSIEFDFDSVNYEEHPVGQDTGGDPIVVAVRARSRRNANGLAKVLVKNQTAT